MLGELRSHVVREITVLCGIGIGLAQGPNDLRHLNVDLYQRLSDSRAHTAVLAAWVIPFTSDSSRPEFRHFSLARSGVIPLLLPLNEDTLDSVRKELNV